MKRLFRCFASCLSLLVWDFSAAAEPSVGAYTGPKEKLHVYLLMGGAEMAGEVDVPEQASGVIERCYLLNPKGEWEPAKAPLNRYSQFGGDTAKLDPGLGFARRMLEQNKEISIGLIGCASPSSKIEDWYMKSDEYRQARKFAKLAKKTGTLRGVLWQNSASFSMLPLSDLKTMITYFRSDVDMLNLPFVVGGISESKSMNVQLETLEKEVHAAGLASADGLVANDAKKLDAPSVLTQGSRFADTMLALHVVWDKRGDRKPPTDIGIVDPHIHAMSNKPDGLDSLAKWMERNHVERTIVSPLDGSRAITEDERKIMFANFEKYRGKIDRFCLIKPDEVKTVEEAVAILEKEKAEGAVAFGEHYGDNMMFDDPRNMRLYAACEKVGLPVMFHIDTNKNMDEPGLPRVEHVLKTYPNCKLIAHAQWWLHLVEGACDRQLREHPNLYADISGTQMAAMLNRDRNYTREFLIRHQDRILFGSDAGWWSFNNDQATESQFSVLEELDLPVEVRRKIYRENSIKLFGLKP